MGEDAIVAKSAKIALPLPSPSSSSNSRTAARLRRWLSSAISTPERILVDIR